MVNNAKLFQYQNVATLLKYIAKFLELYGVGKFLTVRMFYSSTLRKLIYTRIKAVMKFT